MKKKFIFLIVLYQISAYMNIYAQAIQINGTVTEKNGNPLPGVSVNQKGTNNGSITDQNGKYSLAVSSLKGTVVFSFIGFEKAELPINKKTINAVLQESVKTLSEVVVVGYGTTKRVDITGAVSSVKSDAAEGRVVFSIGDILKGKVSGVRVSSSDGAPGSGQSINIRGTTSLSGDSNPLYVIDGFLSDNMSNVSPGDIETIDILKDASSTAIYGSRGANGVILITTKKGKKNQPKINFYALGGVQTATNLLDMMNSEEFIDKNYFFSLTYVPKAKWKPTSFKPAAYNFYQDTEGNYYVISKKAAYSDYFNGERQIEYNTDWQNEMMRDAAIRDYRIDISGGGDKNTYAVMLGYKYQEGIMIKTDYKNYSARANFSQELLSNLNFRLNSSIDRNFRSGFANGTEGVIYNTLTQAPIRPSNFSQNDLLPGESSASLSVVNPVSQANLITNNMNNYSFLTNGSLDYNTGKFTIRLTGGYFLFAQTDEQYYPSTVAQGLPFGGRAYIGNSSSERLNNENTITYSNTFNNIHKVNFLVGNSVEQVNSKWLNTENRGFVLEDLGIYGISQGTNPQIPNSTIIKQTNTSFFSRINYDVADKYLFKFTMRGDGASRFAANNKWGYFPSAAAAWKISQEDFVKNLNIFSNLKLRSSWGISGKQSIPSYQSLPTVGTWNVSIDGTSNSLISYFTRIANENLTWEKTEEYNIGLDVGLWKDRLSFSVDVYNRLTRDLLYYVPIPSYTGFDNALKNTGKIENEGIEFSINANPIKTKDFNWNFNFNISHNASKVLKLGDQNWQAVDVGYLGVGQGYLQEGLPIGNWYGYKTNGIWQSQAEIDQAIKEKKLLASEGIKPGYVKYVDLNNDGKKTAEDRQILGNGQPRLTGGFSNNISYKGISLDFTLQYSVGNKIYNANRYRLESGFSFDNAFAETADRWRPTLYNYDPITKQTGDLFMEGNSSNRYPIAIQGKNVDEAPIDLWIEDGSFLRLADVTFSYSLPKKIISKMNMSNLKFFITGSNLFILTKYTGYDPEVNNSQGAASFLMPGLDYFSYPRARTISAGINLTL
jgi:TonB-linked SusC/RagA family outer membrane protein